MIICFIIKIHFKRLLQMQNLHGVFTARSQRAHDALKDPTTLPHRCHSMLSNTLWKRQAAAFVLSMLKVNNAAWRSRRLHSVSTALLAFAQRAPRRSAIFKRCGNAVRTPLWCDRGYTPCVSAFTRTVGFANSSNIIKINTCS